MIAHRADLIQDLQGLPVRLVNIFRGPSSGWRLALLGLVAGVLTTLLLKLLVSTLKRLFSGRSSASHAAASASRRSLHRSSLRAVWNRFLLGLPYGARASVKHSPTVIVLGLAGVGKTRLISAKVDWQGQNNQFLPSYIDDPLLQIYLGSKLVAEELSAPVLVDIGSGAARALHRLWARFSRQQPPVVVVVLKLPALSQQTPDELQQQALIVRGKLSLLAQILGEPAEVRIVLSHMDQVPGYSALARLFNESGIPVDMPLVGALQDQGLSKTLGEFEKYLPLALSRLPASGFREVVHFLRTAPSWLASLESFVRPLGEGSALSPPPRLENLYFFAPERSEQGGNPLRVSRRAIERAAAKRPLIPPALWAGRWHLAGCLLGAMLFLLAGGVVVNRHHNAVLQAESAVAHLEEAVRRAHDSLGTAASESTAMRAAEKEARGRLEALQAASRRSTVYRLLYQRTKSALIERHLTAIRSGYLLPLVSRFVSQNDVERTVYALAVLYATHSNALGGLLSIDLPDIAGLLEVPEGTLSSYLQLSSETWVGVATMPWQKLSSGGQGQLVRNLQTWVDYFIVLERVFSAARITPDQLQALRRGAEPLLMVVDSVGRNQRLAQIFHVLVEESPLLDLSRRIGELHPSLQPPPWLRDQHAALSGILHLVHDTNSNEAAGGPLDLRQVLQLLNQLGERERTPDRVFSFELRERAFSFSARAWLDLMLRSRHQSTMGGVAAHQRAGSTAVQQRSSPVGGSGPMPGSLPVGTAPAKPAPPAGSSGPAAAPAGKPTSSSTAPTAPGPAVEVVPTGGAPPQASVRYNRPAFEKDMKSVLQQLGKKLGEGSALPPQLKAALNAYVMEEAKAYASSYCAAVMEQLHEYRFSGGSLDDTHTALLEVLQPNGSLMEHLRGVVDNANVGELSGPYLQPLAACLVGFKPLVAVMTPAKEGGYPQLKPYADLIGAILKEIGTGEPAGVREDGKPPALSALLSPLGRLGLAVLTEQESSPARRLDQFLDATGLRGPLAPPFVAPLRHVMNLGLAEVEQTLAEQWDTALWPQITPLLTRYPFDAQASEEVTPAALDLLRPSDGAFWTAFRGTFGSLCVEQRGQWTLRKWPRGTVELPEGMLPRVNELARVSRALYHRDGSRQQQLLSIKALPVVANLGSAQAAGSFIGSGKALVHAFNDQPVSRPLVLPWWDQDVATVGVEFAAGGAGRRQTQTLEIADSAWSFYRLLDRAKASENQLLTWELPLEGQSPCQIRFVLSTDPRESFRMRVD